MSKPDVPVSKSPQSGLFEIMVLAKKDPRKASDKILLFAQKTFPRLRIIKVRVNTSKVSLNSVNGFLEDQSGRTYFFKFHAEEGETITVDEYYQAAKLLEAGLPMVKPLYESTQPGSQFLIYERIEAPTAFEAFEECDYQYNKEKTYDEKAKEALLDAERRLLRKVSEVYVSSLEDTGSSVAETAVLNQLFYRRLVPTNGEKPRLDTYYTTQSVRLPDGTTMPFEILAKKRWVISGVAYDQTLGDIIEDAKKLLGLQGEGKVPTVLGHGDDHNGNKFFQNGSFVLFDPAFAGRQHALLSFVKATAHNAFLHPFWLYEPSRLKEAGFELTWKIEEDTISVAHNWDMQIQSPIRNQILDIQAEEVWIPLLRAVKARNMLPENWREYLRKALFCCPFLVYDLIDPEKYDAEASLLALSKCVELGASGNQQNYVDNFLDKLADSLA